MAYRDQRPTPGGNVFAGMAFGLVPTFSIAACVLMTVGATGGGAVLMISGVLLAAASLGLVGLGKWLGNLTPRGRR